MSYTNVIQRIFTCVQVQTSPKAVSRRRTEQQMFLCPSHISASPCCFLFPRSTNTYTKTTAKGRISLSSESHNCQTAHSMLCQCIDIRATGNVSARVLFKEAISTPSTRGSLMQCSRKLLRVRYSKPTGLERVQPCKLNTTYTLCNSCQTQWWTQVL